MKTTFILFSVLFAATFYSFGQTLSEELGSIKTDFIIVSNGNDIQVTHQSIIKRAESKAVFQRDEDSGAGYGLGYQSLHLEFQAEEIIQTVPFRGRIGEHRNPKYELKFYDEDGNLLATIRTHQNTLQSFSNEDVDASATFYSLDIKDVPLVLLDQTVKIDIALYKSTR